MEKYYMESTKVSKKKFKFGDHVVWFSKDKKHILENSLGSGLVHT